ncbi:TonB-dependent receptor [Sphingomonas sp. RP10(2022)]|uniref:TonB-dependent receptor n=1 Tax=Sphingomonas liriopis TaxID=2949094 RepID=A0A9X2KNE3_9SPHN|nr:TonB-dependent receptor [Sphingomonas liriopis]MCP3733569.1 TonB-dependent receptor [Sphingomonas liriopis]
MTLDRAVLALARAGGVDIVSTEPGLRTVRTRPLAGRMTIARALDRLLADTGYRAVAGRAGGYRIVATPLRRPRPRPVLPPPQRPAPVPADIVVTASKQRVPLLRYPGSLTLVTGTPRRPDGGTGDVTDLARQLPILQSTQLGPGRNKVFIRGIADSSFNGTTQSTASVYLDDVQLNASGPDPGLRLYDMRTVEVMEGPQGTLYGAGAIGGVLRLTSNAPELGRVAGSLGVGVTTTQSGAPGYDLAGMVNLPLVDDRLALRSVVYAVRDGGYIDDRRRGARNVNRTDTVGLRLALRADPGDGWRVETGGVAQRIASRDGQYAQRGDGPLTRSTAVAQPFTDRFLFGRLTIVKDWDSGLHLVSATGVADYRTDEVFDATPPTGPAARTPILYRLDNDKLLLSQELRLSRSLADGRSWLAGFSLVSDRSILTRSLRSGGEAIDIVGVSNVTRAASGFAEATAALAPDLSVTLGGRYTSARVDGEPSSTRRPVAFIKGRSTQRFDPTVALSYRIAPDLAAFARYQTGFRTGGLAVAQGVGRVANFDADSIDFAEVGVRRLRHGATGLGLSLSGSAARWTGIQADLLNRRGQPFTTNLGDARIQTVETSLDWVPVPRFTIAASALYTHNTVYGPIADQSRLDNRRLPETPPFAAHAALDYAWPEGTVTPRVGATIGYVGRSVLGTGDLLDVSQGDYLLLGLSAGARWRELDVTLGLDNLTNARVNRFAFGNPFGLATRDQTTPLRPRNLRIGVATAW